MANFPTILNNLSGKAFLRATANKSNAERDEIATNLVLKGNFPSFLRKTVPITISDENNTLVYNVCSDFLSIGNDQDYIIWPFTAPSAQRIADSFGCILPTPKMSKQIWQNASIKLDAKPLSGMTSTIQGITYSPEQFVKSKHMTSPQGIYAHNRVIQKQLNENQNYRPGDLVAGHKKDMIVSNNLIGSNSLGLYGLYDKNGKPIQSSDRTPHPYSNHLEYAQGIRLIDNVAILNGNKVNLLNDVLKSKEYAYLVNDGVLKYVGYKYSDKPKEQNMSSSSGDLRPMSNYPLVGGIPKGYISFKANEPVPASVTQVAIQIRDKFINMPFGTVIPFKTEDGTFMAEIMPHSNKPRGVTVFKKNETFNGQPKSNSSLDKIYQYYQEANEQMKGIIG